MTAREEDQGGREGPEGIGGGEEEVTAAGGNVCQLPWHLNIFALQLGVRERYWNSTEDNQGIFIVFRGVYFIGRDKKTYIGSGIRSDIPPSNSASRSP